MNLIVSEVYDAFIDAGASEEKAEAAAAAIPIKVAGSWRFKSSDLISGSTYRKGPLRARREQHTCSSNVQSLPHVRTDQGDPMKATEAKILIERWRREYNQIRPHSSLGYRPPAPEARWVPPAQFPGLQATQNGPAILT